MNRVLHRLASLTLAVVLLVLLLAGLAAGTMIESAQGTEAAGRLVYYSWWFFGLEGLFALNVLTSIITHFPWGRARIGFATTHSALLLILVGAGASYLFKIEGRIELWEGQSGSEIADHDRDGRVISQATLPFAIQLEHFRVERYQGTQRPSNFRSDVRVTDGGKSFSESIWMNHELSYRGYRFFQSSYREEGDRRATVLAVSKDPGQPIVFCGYALLLIGMCIVLATRIAAARARSAPPALNVVGGKKIAAAAAALLAILAGPARAGPVADQVRLLPVQHDGRVMPLDTLARESAFQVTGSEQFKGEDAVALVLRWTFSPREAVQEPVILIDRPLAEALALRPGATHASFAELSQSPQLRKLIEEAHQAAAQDRPRTGALAAADKLEERVGFLQSFLDRDALRALPRADRWAAPQLEGPDQLTALASGARLEGWPSLAALEREVTYNQVRPARIAWLVLGLSFVLALLALRSKRKSLDLAAFLALLAGFAVMTWGIATRWAIAGRVPASNLYESLLFLGWGVGLFAVIAFLLTRIRLLVLNAAAMAALTMALTDLLPLDRFVHPVAPVLSGTPWLAIHVPIIMVSYSVLALGVFLAHVQIGFAIFAPRRRELIQRFSELLYWYLQAGSILLIAGILSGSVWAASSWGRYWGWDPKEVWSLVAFLAYLAILHARTDKLLAPFGVAAMSIVAFQAILMTYLGVNFVLTTGMHSYGMGDSPVMGWMVAVALVEAIFLVAGFLAHRRARAQVAAVA